MKINDKVEDFELESYHNDQVKKVKLSRLKGKWVVMVFYPADFTFICPTELEELADVHEDDFDKIYKGEVSKSGTAVLPSKRAKRIPEKIKFNLETSDDKNDTLKEKTEEKSEVETTSSENKSE